MKRSTIVMSFQETLERRNVKNKNWNVFLKILSLKKDIREDFVFRSLYCYYGIKEKYQGNRNLERIAKNGERLRIYVDRKSPLYHYLSGNIHYATNIMDACAKNRARLCQAIVDTAISYNPVIGKRRVKSLLSTVGLSAEKAVSILNKVWGPCFSVEAGKEIMIHLNKLPDEMSLQFKYPTKSTLDFIEKLMADIIASKTQAA